MHELAAQAGMKSLHHEPQKNWDIVRAYASTRLLAGYVLSEAINR